MQTKIITLHEYPNHAILGQFYYGFDQQVYLCESFDPDAGFWMTNVLDHSLRKCVSISAIDRTWHSASNDWRKVHQHDVQGKNYDIVDTTVSADALTIVAMDDKDLVGKSEWVVLFVWHGDATKFVRRIREAAARLSNDQGAPATTACATSV